MDITNKEHIINRADKFAEDAFVKIDHRRKYSLVPYMEHPREVAKIVWGAGGTDEQIAAALLHDTVEDTPVTIEEIIAEFGELVGMYVADLTDVSKPEDGNRAVRKQMDREHLAAAHPDSKTIKLADMLDNGHDIAANDPDFAVVYMRVMRITLSDHYMGNATNKDLLARARAMVYQYYEEQELEKFFG